MKKILGAGAAALMTVTLLSGCGGSSGDSSSSGGYCDDIKAASSQLSNLSGDAFTSDKFTAVNTVVHNIAGEAPADIKPSWTLISTQFDALKSALSDAGLSMDDFSKLAAGGTPPSVDPAKLAALETKLQSFDSKGLSAAADKIQTQVKSDCNIDLNSGS